MFKAIDIKEQKEIIIIDDQWNKESIEDLRSIGQNNQLICPECEQPVLVKAGEIKQWHFSHRNTSTCPLRNESEAVLKGRVILYRWLSKKYPDKVSLEKSIPDIGLPRPLDCYIETDTGKRFAYWILESGFRSHGKIKLLFLGQDIYLHMIFLSNMIRKGPDELPTLVLTPTERSFAYRSEYNQLYSVSKNSALTYLDLTTQYLHTFRGLFLVHKPNVFTYKKRLTEQLDKMLISPKNGEFVYPGEYEKRQSIKHKIVKASENDRVKKKKSHRRSSKKNKYYPDESISSDTHLDYLTNTYPCKQCGEQTSAWVKLDMSTKTCICRKCIGTFE